MHPKATASAVIASRLLAAKQSRAVAPVALDCFAARQRSTLSKPNGGGSQTAFGCNLAMTALTGRQYPPFLRKNQKNPYPSLTPERRDFTLRAVLQPFQRAVAVEKTPNDGDSGERLARLEARIRKAEANAMLGHKPAASDPLPSGDLSAGAARTGVDFAAPIIVCAGAGWLIDSWLESGPLGTLSLLALGFAVGCYNVWRTLDGRDATNAKGSR